jgi:hypothetical protein
VIRVGIGRHHFGDHSEACLAALADVASWSDGALRQKTIDALLEGEPTNDEDAEAIAEKPAGRFMIRSRIRVVKRHPEGDW